jgi:hypothetical protein
MLRTAFSRKPSEGMKRGEPLISSGNRTTSSLFQVQKEIRNDVRREVVDNELINCCFALSGDERQKQAEGVAIALLCIS